MPDFSSTDDSLYLDVIINQRFKTRGRRFRNFDYYHYSLVIILIANLLSRRKKKKKKKRGGIKTDHIHNNSEMFAVAYSIAYNRYTTDRALGTRYLSYLSTRLSLKTLSPPGCLEE